MKFSARRLALEALARWRRSNDFANEIVAALFTESDLSSPDRAFALELFYGVLRNLTLLDFWVAQLRSEPVEVAFRDLLRLGLYQILLLETADHAAVFETVALAPARGKGVTNAILRRALREKNRVTSLALEQPRSIQFSEPEFLLQKWTGQFGEKATLDLCRWNNRPPPVYARINQIKISQNEFMNRYPDALPCKARVNFVRLAESRAPLAAGHCYLQDPSTALACELLAPERGESVLDACAAPGGKTAYLAEMMKNEGRLIACDLHPARLSRLRENLSRLGASAEVVNCNWLEPESIRAAGFEPNSFDRILVDAPCTNTGVMRRRVDVRWRLQPNEFSRMQKQQLAILRAVRPLLRPGGSLVYSTCSLEQEENGDVVSKFSQEHAGFSRIGEKVCLPFRDNFDGAFATLVTSTR